MDNSVQKYLIKLGKKRKTKQRCDKAHDQTAGTHSQLSPQHAFNTSVFYDVPAARVEKQQRSTNKVSAVRKLYFSVSLAVPDIMLLFLCVFISVEDTIPEMWPRQWLEKRTNLAQEQHSHTLQQSKGCLLHLTVRH